MELNVLLELIEQRKFATIRDVLSLMHDADIAEFINELDAKDAIIVYRLLAKDQATNVFSFLTVDKQSEITMQINDHELQSIMQDLYFDDMIDLLEEVPAHVVKRIMRNAPANERKLINQFLNYEEDTAGSIMTIEFVDLKKSMSVGDAMARIRRIGLTKETIYTCYVIDANRKLEGILSLKQLILNDTDTLIGDIMQSEVISVSTSDDQEMIANIFKKYDFLSLPVVDMENRLVGIITIDDIVDVMEEETTEDFQKMAAIGAEEIEYMSISSFDLAKKRITWLVILMFSAIITELITDSNDNLTAQFTMLIGVMPMLMSTGGNAGAQSSTLIIRGITLGDIKFTDILKVMTKEVRVGLLMGGTLGLLNFTRIAVMDRDIRLAIIVGLTLVGTTVTATCMGGLLPILAKKIKLDPATMANPLITTITDTLTLIIFFAIAAAFLL